MSDIKGMQLPDTLAHLSALGQRLGSKREEQIVSAVLLELGTPTKQPGFDYLQHAVPIYRADPTQLITKELYPAVAQLYRGRANAQQIERAIRISVEQTFRLCDRAIWKLYFPETDTRPSNAAFISRLARLVDLWEAQNR